MALIYDLVDPAELQGFVRATVFPQYSLLNGVLPPRPVDDIEYRFSKGDFSEMDVAPYRAFDAEAPLGTRQGVTRMAGELPPISKKMRLGEEQRFRLRQLQGATGGTQAIVDQIFDDAARLARSVAGRLELACGDALVNGKVTIAENGVAAVVDYGYVSAQKVTAGTVWSNAAADVVGDLQTWVDAYVTRTGGYRPGYILTSTKVRNQLLRNTAIRNLYGTTVNGSPGMITVDTLGAVLNAFDLPPIRTYDTALPVGGVTTRVIADNIALLMPADAAGATFTGTTAEALELAGANAIRNDQLAGMTAVVEKTFDPVSTWTKVSALALPVLYRPEAITVATVL